MLNYSQDRLVRTHLSHEKAILIDLCGAMVCGCPCDCHMVPSAITLQDAGSGVVAVLGVAADVVVVGPDCGVGERMTGNHFVNVKYGKVVEVSASLLGIGAVGVKRIRHDGFCNINRAVQSAALSMTGWLLCI